MHYTHLDTYSDLVKEANRQADLFPLARPGMETVTKVREVLGFCDRPEEPLLVEIEDRWEEDGLIGETISWSDRLWSANTSLVF